MSKEYEDQLASDFEVDAANKAMSTKGFRKILYYYLDIIQNEKFLKDVLKLRKKHGIPKECYPFGEVKEVRKYPFSSETDHKLRDKQVKAFTADVSSLCRDYDIPVRGWQEVLEGFVIFGEIIIPRLLNAYNFCMTMDHKEKTAIGIGKVKQKDIKDYPVSILISPDASKNDILDYIKAMYKYDIEPIQKKYRKKDSVIGKTRKRSRGVRERNQFIYENAHLPRKDLTAQVNELFGTTLGYEEINKILSQERKKRSD